MAKTPDFDLTDYAPRFNQARERADGMIRAAGEQAVLRRVGYPDEWVWIMKDTFNPFERLGKAVDPIDRKIVLSDVDLPFDILAQYRTTRVVTFKQPLSAAPVEDESLVIVQPPGKAERGGIVFFWRLTVRR